jgi:CRISPR-associated Csx14 family protein
MKKVLIATLGESPIVISAMVKVLQEQKNIRLDKVIVLYPKAESRWINFGYDLLQDHFSKHPEIEAIELSFDDAYTESHSIEFLRTLNGLLLQQKGLGHEVHLSLAGGRKHTSVLMGLLTQFYPMVKGLYHLHDTAEHQPHQRRTIEQLINLSETQRRHYLSPPAERFRLVDLPCESLAQAEPLQQWLMQYEASETPAPVPISPHAESFYGMLFDQDRAASNSPLLEIWLTQTAYDQYCRWYQQGSSHLAIIDTYP